MIITGPDEALWFTENQSNKIGTITIFWAITEFDIPTTSGPVGICRGTVFEYLLPTENAKPHAIVSGKAGDIWFTEWGSNQIGRFTSCGKITEYQIHTTGAELHGPVLGQDGGAIWFAEESDKKVLIERQVYGLDRYEQL